MVNTKTRVHHTSGLLSFILRTLLVLMIASEFASAEECFPKSASKLPKVLVKGDQDDPEPAIIHRKLNKYLSNLSEIEITMVMIE